MFLILERGDFLKNTGIFLQLNVKLFIIHKYLKYLHISDSITCFYEDNLSIEDPTKDQTSITLWTIE